MELQRRLFQTICTTQVWTVASSQAALKVLYLVATQRRKNRSDLTRKMNGWKSILNTLTVHYGDRITASTIN